MHCDAWAMTRVTGEPCVVLHTRPYRESSLLMTVFSLDHGRVSLVARGARGGRRGRTLQPFALLQAGWSGRGGLATLTACEARKQYWFRGDALAAGFYVAELLMRLAGEREGHPRLFAALCWTLDQLEQDLEAALRSFEMVLLEELGYAVDLAREADGGRPIQPDKRYRFDPQHGFSEFAGERGYPGAVLQTIARGEFSDPQVRRAAKRLFNKALAVHLGPTPLMSRRLLAGLRRRAPPAAPPSTAGR